jgi:hypothetical protein
MEKERTEATKGKDIERKERKEERENQNKKTR